MSFIETIKQRARSDVKTIVLPESEDDRTILAAAKVLAEGTAAPIIIGTEEEVMGSAARLGADLTGVQILDHTKSAEIDKYATLLAEIRAKKGMTFEKAKELIDAAQEAGADVVERAAPDRVQPRHELSRALKHLLRGAVGEREEKDAFRRHALLHQVGDAVHERARLARAGRRQHKERTVRRRRRRTLLGVENLAEIYSVHGNFTCHYTKSPPDLTA